MYLQGMAKNRSRKVKNWQKSSKTEIFQHRQNRRKFGDQG